ncbi:MAG: lamin tail domain-containing protein [Ruminococcaceae bacterium]|nr:lamin tail domain-containing protein [Oscillospiraceae bacterium]
MRKFLAVLLTVMMLAGVLVALPTSAAVATSSFDGTKSDAKIDLVITEMLVNSKTGQESLDNQQAAGSVSVFSSPDAFDYIEIYNRGTQPVNIYNYVIMSAPARDFTGDNQNNTLAVNEANKYKFTKQNVIFPGDIHSAEAGAASGSQKEYNSCSNPNGGTDGYINPGEFAVIWFWTSATDTLCSTLGSRANVGGRVTGDDRTFPYFRDFYELDDDVKVFVTNAKTSSGNENIFNDLKAGWIYALVDNTQGTGMVQRNQSAVTISGGNKTLNSRIACMAEYATYTPVGIVTTDNMDDVSAYYLPAGCVPHLYNKNQKAVVDSENQTALERAKEEAIEKGETFDEAAEAAFKADPTKWKTFTEAVNYVDIGYAHSFKETAIVSFTEEPTPGGMPAWQWMYVDPVTVSGQHSHGLPVLEGKIYAAAVAEAEDMIDAGTIEESAKDITVSSLFNNRMNKFVSDWLSNADIKAESGRLLAETGETTWQAQAMVNFERNYVAEIEDEIVKDETKKNYEENFVSREELEERHKDKKKNKDKNDKGLPTWALILIIVGGVLVLGGVAAVVVVVVLKKKGKATASDDVAAEGEVLVIDETKDETPADAEAPVAEEAPAEEEKPE